jgi:hypothetical protein
MCDNPVLAALLQQKNERKRFNIPPTRFSLVNPYRTFTGQTSTPNGITQEDLNMRRKAEILKYKSKNGTQTASQRYASIVRGTGSRSVATNSCDQIPKPSSASGIPGPSVDLVLDPTVPLYNYNSGAVPYSNNNNGQFFTDYYRFHPVQSNIILPFTRNNSDSKVFNMSTPVRIGMIEFVGDVPNPSSTVEFTVFLRCRFDISGVITDNKTYTISIDQEQLISSTHTGPVRVSFSDTVLLIYYNNSEIVGNNVISIDSNEVSDTDNVYIQPSTQTKATNTNAFEITTTLDLPSERGYIYGVDFQIDQVNITGDDDIPENITLSLVIMPTDISVKI